MQNITEFERSVSERLAAAAAEMDPTPDALDAVRARAAARRRGRRRAAAAVVSVAASLAVVAAVAVWSTGGPRSEVTAGPAGEPSTAVAEASGSVPSELADATLVIYRYPNATAEMIAEDPKMGGEWAVLHTAERSYHANGPLSELGANSTPEESNYGDAFATLDSAAGLDGFGPQPDAAVWRLTEMITSGVGTADQVAKIRGLLETAPGVTVTESDGVVSIILESPAGLTSHVVFMYDSATGRPLSVTYPTEPASAVEYVSVTRVRAADVLVPGRGTPLPPSTTSTPTTEVPG